MSPDDLRKVEEITRELLVRVGENPEREGLLRTPHRVAKAWDFLTNGYRAEFLHQGQRTQQERVGCIQAFPDEVA